MVPAGLQGLDPAIPPGVTPLPRAPRLRVKHFATARGGELAAALEEFLSTRGRMVVQLSYSSNVPTAPFHERALLVYTEPEEHDA